VRSSILLLGCLASCTPVRYSTDAGVTLERVDLLFVVDNSSSTTAKQKTLNASFPSLLSALRDGQHGGDLPDLQIGVVSTDLGAGGYDVPTCKKTGGDGARLLNSASSVACKPPGDAWIHYSRGVTNIDGGSADPVARVAEAFACIAELGTNGCGFEQPLEAARRALDPQLALNPGFLRAGALLAVVIITDEDDCSVARPELLELSTAVFGPLSSFRCIEYGLTCDESLSSLGDKHNCQPGRDWLTPVGSYRSFFDALGPRVVLAALAGPAVTTLTVKQVSASFNTDPSCEGSSGAAASALRVQRVISDAGGVFNEGLDSQGGSTTTNICSASYQAFFQLLGKRILDELHRP
jgi:hypothetical protein